MSNTIEKQVEIAAPVSRVWQALTDYRQFGEWFKVALDSPFELGKVSRGRITHPGFEHLEWHATVKEMKPEHLFSFTWHPYAIEPGKDYSTETPTLVEFRLEPAAHGSLLVVTETGFDNIPEHRRSEAFRMNERGWVGQIRNIERHVMSHAGTSA